MPIRITCPGCKTALKLSDDKRGKKVRCSNCEKVLNIPGMNGKKHDDGAGALQEGQKLKAKAAAREEEQEPQEDEQEQPVKKKKKKKKKKSSMTALLIGGGVGVLLLLIVAVSASAYYFTRPDDGKKPLVAAQSPGPIVVAKNPGPEERDDRTPQRIVVPTIKEGNPANIDKKVGGKSVTGTLRGAAWVTERKNELREIGRLYNLFCDAAPKSGRTQDEFIKYIQRDAKSISESIKDGYYAMNMRAELAGSSIVAYETNEYAQGYLCVRGDASVDFVSVQEWKTILGK